MTTVLALLIGIIAGLRAMTAPAAVGWAAHLGWFDVSGTPLAFMGYRWTPWIFTALALIELVTDQLPNTPSRKVPMQFGARILMGHSPGAPLARLEGRSPEAYSLARLVRLPGRLGVLPPEANSLQRSDATLRPPSSRVP